MERDDGRIAHELAHEYLISKIGLGAEAKRRKEAEELITQEVENWRRFGTLLGADKLALIADVRQVLRLSPEAQELLFRSALQVGHDAEYWRGRVTDPVRQIAVLTEAAHSRLTTVRQRAARLLGTEDRPEAVEPLLMLAIQDADPAVRLTAQESLSKLTTQRPNIVAQLLPEVESAQPQSRRNALETLARLPLRGLPAGLRSRVLATRLRLRATWLARTSVATPARRAVLLTFAILLALIGFAYILGANSYHLGTEASVIPGQFDVVVKRGLPRLWLPGLGQVIANTGLGSEQIAGSEWPAVSGGRLWGLWAQRDARGLQGWAPELERSLRPEYRIPTTWYLERDDKVLEDLFALGVAGRQVKGMEVPGAGRHGDTQT